VKDSHGNLLEITKQALLLINVVIFLWAVGPMSIVRAQSSDTWLYPYYDDSDTSSLCSANTTGSADNSSDIGNKMYVIGDSLTIGMRDLGGLQDKLTAKGWNVTKITANSGYSVTDSLPVADSDLAQIQQANVIVVALGTNSSLNVQADTPKEAFMTHITAMLAKFGSKKVFWVNAYVKVSGKTYTGTNSALSTAAESKSITNIDFSNTAQRNPQEFEFAADGIHMTNSGYGSKSDFVVNAVGSPKSATINDGDSSSGQFDPMGLGFPAFPNESAVGPAITSYIKEVEPTSPWLTMPGVGENVGNWIMSESKSRAINPMFIVTSGKVENQYGTSGDAPSYNNFFGIKDGDTYRRFPTPQAGIQYFMDKIKENTQSGQGRYAPAKNLYEYMSIHQTGSIVYPRDDFDPNERDDKPGTKDLYDPHMNVYISWDPARNADNPNPDRRGQYTPLIYYNISVDVINGILGTNLQKDNPQRAGGAPCSGAGTVNINGYSFPLAPQTKAVSGIKPDQTQTTHHDTTPAFDLYSTDSADVYAIYGGVPTKINTNYHDQPGCSSIMFKADDGYYYWYGHLKNVVVQEGVHIASGTKMAQIADKNNFNRECWGGGPHLHIDRGCVIAGVPQTGGEDDCRDPEFIPFLSALYKSLPG
jgi:lysophospholipase L1-like esterase